MAHALDIWAPVDVTSVVMAQPQDAAPPCEQPARSPLPDEDEDLINRLAANDEAAFRQLVERHIDRAFAIALRILGSRADAEDVVQDSMLKVWTHRGQWQHGRAKFSTWLYRVVTNRCIDLYRQPQRLPEQQRVAVILSYQENMSNGEIAEVMDTTVAAVESLLKRGRQQLRELLRRHERDIRHVFTDY